MDVELRANDNKEAGISDLNVTLGFYLQRFLQFDTDKNGYLNEAEFAALQLPGAEFAAVDADRDGMLTRDELRQHVQHSAALSQAALVLTLSDEAKTLFEILDADRDNRLGPREFAAAAAQLREYDRDRDSRIGRAELRDKFGFTVSAARPQFLNEPFNNPNNMAQARQGRPRPQTAGPTWFRKMDRNQDGDLTWREFLGTRADFDRIDADGSGLIDLNEAVGASAASAATSASQ
jgi:Ca2+-binding EF-hand superfamily protein